MAYFEGRYFECKQRYRKLGNHPSRITLRLLNMQKVPEQRWSYVNQNPLIQIWLDNSRRMFWNKGGAIDNSNTIGSEKSRGTQSAAKLGYINPWFSSVRHPSLQGSDVWSVLCYRQEFFGSRFLRHLLPSASASFGSRNQSNIFFCINWHRNKIRSTW